MNNNGFSGTRIIGFDHNWGDAGSYPIEIVSFRVLCYDTTIDSLQS